MCNTRGKLFPAIFPSKIAKLELLLLRKKRRGGKGKNAFDWKESIVINRIIIREGGESWKLMRWEIIIDRCALRWEVSVISRKKNVASTTGIILPRRLTKVPTNTDRNRKTTISYIYIYTRYEIPESSNRRFLSRKIITNFIRFPRLLCTREMGRNSNF